jgi:hypothetical protein
VVWDAWQVVKTGRTACSGPEWSSPIALLQHRWDGVCVAVHVGLYRRGRTWCQVLLLGVLG